MHLNVSHLQIIIPSGGPTNITWLQKKRGKSKSNLQICCIKAETWNGEAYATSLRSGNTARFEKAQHWWRAVSNRVSDLTDLRFEPHSPETNVLQFTTQPTTLAAIIIY